VSESSWIVSRTEHDGRIVRTGEVDAQEAQRLYANWAGNARRFGDQEISLLEVMKTTKTVQRFINTAATPEAEEKSK
jgi:hypothetical protein